MGWKETFAKALGLGDNASEDDVALKLAERIAGQSQNSPPVGSSSTPAAQTQQFTVPEGLSPQLRQIAELFGQQFAELQKQVGEQQQMMLLSNMMSQQFGEMQSLLTNQQNQLQQTRAQQLTDQLASGSGKWALPAQTQNRLRTVMLSDNPNSVPLTEVGEMLKEIVTVGLVPLGEQTKTEPQKTEPASSPDAITAFVEKVNKYQEEHGGEEKCSNEQALEAVSLTDPAGYTAYRNATFIEGQVK